jgi:hypothetical protein
MQARTSTTCTRTGSLPQPLETFKHFHVERSISTHAADPAYPNDTVRVMVPAAGERASGGARRYARVSTAIDTTAAIRMHRHCCGVCFFRKRWGMALGPLRDSTYRLPCRRLVWFFDGTCHGLVDELIGWRRLYRSCDGCRPALLSKHFWQRTIDTYVSPRGDFNLS